MFVYVSEIAINAPLAASQLPEIAQTARCRSKTHRRRWPGNPNGRLKFHDLSLITLARSQLTLRRRLRGWRRLRRSFKRHIADVESIAGVSPAMSRIDQSSTIMQIFVFEIKQKLSKNIFLLLGSRYYDGIAHWFFFNYHLQQSFCSHL